jgi:hypothetical protein
MDKYLGSQPLHHWIRKSSFNLNRASQFWKGLVASSPVILHWLRWKPGVGSEILLGRDRILGLGDRSLLSPLLVSMLHSKNITSLAQVRAPTGVIHFPNNWMGSGDLSLSGQIAIEWEFFTTALRSAGVSLTDGPDVLFGLGGMPRAASQSKTFIRPPSSAKHWPDFSWTFQIWNWKVPLKLKLFVWLAGKERILTWDALRRRGWSGPGFACSAVKILRTPPTSLSTAPLPQSSGIFC